MVSLNPFRFAFHVVKGTLGRTMATASGFLSANAEMGELRMQLRSYEGKEFFDSKRLARYFRVYKKVKRHLMKYGAEKEGGILVSTYVEKISEKYRNNIDLRNKILAHETGVFADYYKQLLEVMSKIEVTEEDISLQKNAAIIRDEGKIIELIKQIPEKQTAVVMTKDFKSFIKEAGEAAKIEKKATKGEYLLEQRVILGKEAVRGFSGVIGRMSGYNHLTHKLRKLSKRIFTREWRKFHQQFDILQKEIRNKRITPVTIARLGYLLKSYITIRKYYHEIERDIALIMDKLFKDFDVLVKERIMPFYATIKNMNVKGADEIIKINNELVKLHKKFVNSATTKKFEIEKVYAELKNFVETCKNTITSIETSNKKVMENLEKRMVIRPPGKPALAPA